MVSVETSLRIVPQVIFSPLTTSTTTTTTTTITTTTPTTTTTTTTTTPGTAPPMEVRIAVPGQSVFLMAISLNCDS